MPPPTEHDAHFLALRARVHMTLILISELTLTDQELVRYNEELLEFVSSCCARDIPSLRRQIQRLHLNRWQTQPPTTQ